MRLFSFLGCKCAVKGANRGLHVAFFDNSGNEVVRHFIEALGDGVTKTEMERLIGGEIVQKEIHEEMTYHDLYADMGNVWSVLFMTGYLTQRGRADGNLYNLVIPNREIRKILKYGIACWKKTCKVLVESESLV